jgi:hypothetical protein
MSRATEMGHIKAVVLFNSGGYDVRNCHVDSSPPAVPRTEALGPRTGTVQSDPWQLHSVAGLTKVRSWASQRALEFIALC